MSLGIPGPSLIVTGLMRWPSLIGAVVAAPLALAPVDVNNQTTELEFDPPAAGVVVPQVVEPKLPELPKSKKVNG